MKAKRRWPYAGMMGGLISFGIILEMLRPKFNPVNLESVNRSHQEPLIISAGHLFVSVAIIAFPVGLSLTGRCALRRAGNFAVLSCLLIAIAALSLIGQNEVKNYMYVVLLAIAFSAAALFASTDRGQHEGFRELLAVTCIGSAVALTGALGLHEFAYGRLASRAGPTYWGMVSIICFCLTPALRNMRLRVALILMSFLVMVLASARGALLAAMVAGLIQLAGWMRRSPAKHRVYFLSAITAVILTMPLGVPLLADNIFAVSDPRRGLDSGATGRAEAWLQALDLFYKHPFLGVGYRQHEKFITVATSAHEAYLGVLAEMGAPGLTIYLILVIGATARQTFRTWQNPTMTEIAACSFLWAFLWIGFTENLALATGLPMPLIMFFVAARAWTPMPGQRKPGPSGIARRA